MNRTRWRKNSKRGILLVSRQDVSDKYRCIRLILIDVNITNPSKRRKLDRPPTAMNMSPRTSSPINLVSSSPSGPFPSNTNKPSSDSTLSPLPSPLVKAARLSPALPNIPELSTPRPTPTPTPMPATPAQLASDLNVPVSQRRDFQSEIISALDAIYDGGRNRVAMREHETFNLLSHLHVSP
jgi:hypothetical protein